MQLSYFEDNSWAAGIVLHEFLWFIFTENCKERAVRLKFINMGLGLKYGCKTHNSLAKGLLLFKHATVTVLLLV